MSHSLTRVQALLLGLVVLLGLGLVVFALFLIRVTDGEFAVAGYPIWGEKSFHVRAGFQDAQGVSPGTPVRIKGMDAGEVERVEPPSNPGDPVILVLRLSGKQRPLIRADAKVQIVSEGMIGGKAVQ